MPRIKKPERRKAGDGSIRMRSNGKYELRINCVDRYGETKRKTFSGKSEDECYEKYEAHKAFVEKAAQGIDINASIPSILKEHLDNARRLNYIGEQGYARSMANLKIIEKNRIGKMPIIDIKKSDVNFFFLQITKYSNSVISKLYQLLKKAFAIAYDKEIITKNIMLAQDLKRPKSSKVEKKVKGYTIEEQSRLIKALQEYKVPKGRNNYKNQILLELYTGMRMGEINALMLENIDFKQKLIHVRRTISRDAEYKAFIKDGTKTYAGSRDIPMSKKAEAVLKAAIEDMRKNRKGLVFYDYNKKSVIVTSQVNNFFKRLCEKAEVPFNGQHALRHTFATRCIESGIQPVVLKNWLGHTDIHITLDRYADVFAKLHNDAVSQLDEYMESMDWSK